MLSQSDRPVVALVSVLVATLARIPIAEAGTLRIVTYNVRADTGSPDAAPA